MLALKPSDLGPVSKIRVNFDHHHPPINQVNRSSHSKQLNFGPHTVNFDPSHKKHVRFDPNTKNKSNSNPHTRIKLISTPILKSCRIDPHCKIMSISMPPDKNQVNLYSHIKNKYFWTSTQKPSQFRSLH